MKQNNYKKINQRKKSDKTKLFYLYLFAISLFCLALIGYHHLRTKKSISHLLKTYQISSLDMKYKSASQPFFGDGIIFYKVSFPNIALDHTIEKIIVKQESDFIHILMTNVHINVLNTLRKNHNIHIINTLNNYRPLIDSFQKPMHSLALSNIDEIKLNISLVIKQKGDGFITYGQIINPHLIDIDFKARINPSQPQNEGLFYSFYTTATPLSVTIKDLGLFSKYDSYLESLGFEENTPKRSILKKKIMRFLNGDLIDLDLKPAYRNHQD